MFLNILRRHTFGNPQGISDIIRAETNLLLQRQLLLLALLHRLATNSFRVPPSTAGAFLRNRIISLGGMRRRLEHT